MSNHVNTAPPIVLTIAGFDPSGGAGIAADLKTFAAHNCYGVAAVTALTVQSTLGVKSTEIVKPALLRAQIEALLEDCTIAAVKIGMLGNKANAAVIAEILDRANFSNVVLDPVAHSTAGGAELVDAAGLKYIGEELMRRATLITPNIVETELLTGRKISDVNDMKEAARELVARGARAVVIKGGHMQRAIDVLFDGTEPITLGSEHVKTENTHGSGCTFSSAIAAQLALGKCLSEAVMLGKAYVTKAIEKSYATGKGPGPLNHFFRYHQEPSPRGIHELPTHGIHPPAEPATRH